MLLLVRGVRAGEQRASVDTPHVSLGIKMPSASHSDHGHIDAGTVTKGECQVAQAAKWHYVSERIGNCPGTARLALLLT